MKKKFLSIVLAAVLALGITGMTGCNTVREDEITIASIYNGPIFELAARLYMEEHPEKTILTQSIPYDGASDTFKTQMIAGVSPEIMLVEDPDDFANLGLLLDFNEYVAQNNAYAGDGAWSDYFETGYIDLARDNSQRLNWIPFSLYGIGMFTNLSQYETAGISCEALPETISEFKEVGQKLKSAGFTPWGVSIGYDDAQILWPLEMMSKAFFRKLIPEINLLHADGWTFDANDPTSVIGEKISPEEQYLAFKKGLTDPAKSPRIRSMYEIMLGLKPLWNADFVSKSGTEMYTDFPSGKHTHFVNGTWYLPQLTGYFNDMNNAGQSESVFDYKILPFPKPTEADTDYLDAGGVNDIVQIRNGFVVPNTLSKGKTDLAVDFIRFMSSPEVAQKMFDLLNPITGYPYCGDIPLLKNVSGMEEADELRPEIKFADLECSTMYYDVQDKDLFIIDYENLLSGEIELDTFLQTRSTANLAALERNLKLYASTIDRAWLDAELAKLG